MPDSDVSVPQSLPLSQRVAILEERTAPRPKTKLDRVKDWGGVASLVIAIGYSFPLGIWENLIAPGQRQSAAELRELRNVIEETTVILSDGARTIAAIQDPLLRDTAGRAVNTRIFLMLSKHKDKIDAYKAKLTAPELLVIGHNLLMTNQVDAAIPLFQTVLELPDVDVQSKFEAHRQLGKARFSPGSRQDLAAARGSFDAAHRLSLNLPAMKPRSVMLNAEWALFELVEGDWACGRSKLEAATRDIVAIDPYLNDNGNLLKLVQQSTDNLVQRLGQPALGCG